VRASVLEVLHLDFVRTARANGLSERAILLRHVLPNALLPLVTIVAQSAPALFSGVLIVESVFTYPGMGVLIWESVLKNDHLVAIVVFLVYSALDPESRYDFNAEYLMVQALVRGQDPYTSLDVLGARWRPSPYVLFMHPTPHPIFVGWLCLPLAWLTFPQAATVWLALEILCVVASVWIWTRITGPVRPWQGALIVLGLLGWFPLVQEIRHGQLSILLTLLFLGGWLALLRRKEALAGLCLGAMVLIKLIGLPILLWLAWRIARDFSSYVAFTYPYRRALSQTALMRRGTPLAYRCTARTAPRENFGRPSAPATRRRCEM